MAVSVNGRDQSIAHRIAVQVSSKKDLFDKVVFLNPVMLGLAEPSQRLTMLYDEIMMVCHYTNERKLIIIDQVSLFKRDEAT